MMSLAGRAGASVSVMVEPPLDAALEAPALDRISMMAIVRRERVQHPAERMLGRPHLTRLVGHALGFLHQLLADAMERPQGVLPIQMPQRRHQLGVEDS